MYARKLTTELSARDCRGLKQANAHAREIGYPLNTLVTVSPYPGSLPTAGARSADLNRLLAYLRMWMLRHYGAPLTAVWVWHSDVTGRNPHVHVFLHCPPRGRERLSRALVPLYPPSVADVRPGSDIRKPHHSGYWGSTLDYLCRFKSQQAFWADRGKTYRASVRDENGRRRGIKSPILGKRWGCSRNISQRAIEEYWEAKAQECRSFIASSRTVARC